LQLTDYPVYRLVLTIYRVMHKASIPAELLYVFISLPLRTSLVSDDDKHGISHASLDNPDFAADHA
jgi:hypothetical protein